MENKYLRFIGVFILLAGFSPAFSQIYTVGNGGGSSFAGAGGVGSEIPLPVTWLEIGVEELDGAALISWSTAMELNNSHFEIEKAGSNGVFETIGSLNGVGNSVEINHYHFIDHYYNGEPTFYRIRQVDFDGEYEYSHVLKLQSQPEIMVTSISVRPNFISLSKGLNLMTTISGLMEGENQLDLISINGKAIQHILISSEGNEHQHMINLSEIKMPGTFFLQITLPNGLIENRKIHVLP
jgi:hypothetical protein